MYHRCIFLLFSLCVLSGCVSEVPQVKLTLAGGKKVLVDVPRGKVVSENVREVTIRSSTLMTDPAKKLGLYLFGATINKGTPLKSVVVEDVSDAVATTLAVDEAPKVNKGNWSFTTQPVPPADSTIKWITELDESFRTFLYTFTFADGLVVKVHHVTYYPPYLKPGMRRGFGLPE